MVYLVTEDQRKQTSKRSTVFKNDFFALFSEKRNNSMQEILNYEKKVLGQFFNDILYLAEKVKHHSLPDEKNDCTTGKKTPEFNH